MRSNEALGGLPLKQVRDSLAARGSSIRTAGPSRKTSRSLRRNGKRRRGENGCLESVAHPAGTGGSNPAWAPSTAAPNCVRHGRGGAALPCRGRWTSPAWSASSASHSIDARSGQLLKELAVKAGLDPARGRVHSWDVVNEPIEPKDGRDGLRTAVFL